MNASEDDRRRDHRYELDLTVSAETEEGNLELHTSDVSAGGASLSGDHIERLRVGQKVMLDLPMPGRSAPVRTSAEIRWSTSGRAGVRFDAKVHDELQRLLEENRAKSGADSAPAPD